MLINSGFVFFRQFLKQSEFIFSLKHLLTDADYHKYRSRMKKSGVKSRRQVAEEMRDLRDYWHCNPFHYVRYALYERELSREELRDFIPSYIFYVKYLPPLYKGLDIKKLSDKWELYKLLKGKGIPTPEVLAEGRCPHFTSSDGQSLHLEKLIERELKDNNDKLFFKPCGGCGGHGILVLKRGVNGYLLNQQPVDIKQLATYFNPTSHYIVQHGLKQRADAAAINDSSINTLRIVTQVSNDKIAMPVCIMRIGQKHAEVDNSAQGGLSIMIDTDTGTFCDHTYIEHGDTVFYRHPDSGFEFAGKSIADWPEIKQAVLQYADKLNSIPIIAWDVALTVDGPSVIEINFGFGIDHLQCSGFGMRRRFNIFPDNPSR